MASRYIGNSRRVKLALMLFAVACVAQFSCEASTVSATESQSSAPRHDTSRGLVYDGLERTLDGTCDGAFKVKFSPPGQTHCTHGPDLPPANHSIAQSVMPVASSALGSANTITCDGDGASGKRVQVIYAHASDVPDQYAAYLASFQQWAADADRIFNLSAAETGGERHIRFAHDSSCVPSIVSATLSPSGDDSFGNSNGELYYLGFDRTDRDYLVFVDAHVYCGIGGIESDDQPNAANRNNLAPHYARVDAGCWSGEIAAHELMHTLGGVQGTAPHSTGEGHC